MATVKSMKEPYKEQILLLNHVKYEHLVAGVTGGLVSTLALHPLDVIKIRFAANDGQNTTPKYRSILHAFQTISRQEGVTGLYRGVTPNLLGAGSAWGLYFFFYNALKNWVQSGNTQTPLRADQHLLLASEAGIVTLLITNPFWVVKTRLCLQYAQPTQSSKYTSTYDALSKIFKEEGFRGYYRGLIPGIFGVSHGAVQFMVYEEMKNRYNKYRSTSITSKLGTVEYLTFAALSKLVAAATTYPYQVVRVRLQNQHVKYEGMLHCIKKTWQFEGWRGFYKGLGTNLIRVTPATMITFLTYENVSHALIKRSQSV